MAERTTDKYGIVTHTSTSRELGVQSYREVEISLEQDFNLARVIRGVSERTLGVSLEDASGNPVNADGDILLQIYDSFNTLVYSVTDTQTASGEYESTYTPPASASLGVYHATHTFTVSGNEAQVDDWFRVVSTVPGDYSGRVLKGEETWTGETKVVNTYGEIVDADGDVTYTIRSPRGVVLVNNETATRTGTGTYQASYAPGYNDPDGTYYVSFSFVVNGLQSSSELFFVAMQRQPDLAIGAEEFKGSIEGKTIADTISDWTDSEIENALADAQDAIEHYLGYKVSKQVVTGAQVKGMVDSANEIYVNFGAQPIYKLIRAFMIVHPAMSTINLPVSGWNINHDGGYAKYQFEYGEPYTGTSESILNAFQLKDEVDIVLDYESGYDTVPRVVKQAIRTLASGTIDRVSRTEDIKKIKSGNHEVTYFDSDSSSSTNGDSNLSAKELRAYEMLRRAGLRMPTLA